MPKLFNWISFRRFDNTAITQYR